MVATLSSQKQGSYLEINPGQHLHIKTLCHTHRQMRPLPVSFPGSREVVCMADFSNFVSLISVANREQKQDKRFYSRPFPPA